jgi:MFS family permease
VPRRPFLGPYGYLVLIALVAQAALTAVVPLATGWIAHLQGIALQNAVGGAAVALAVTGVVGALFAPLAGRLIDHIGARRTVTLAFWGCAACLLVQAASTGYTMFLVRPGGPRGICQCGFSQHQCHCSRFRSAAGARRGLRADHGRNFP